MAPFSLQESLTFIALCAGVFLAGLLLARLGRGTAAATSSGSPSRMLGSYRLGEKLGAGGMGVVYRAEDLERGRPCAVKLLASSRTLPLDRERFEREARVTRGLCHENIVTVYEYGTTRDGIPYYAMEYVDGQDLQALVDSEGPLPAARAVHLLAQLAGALAEAHAAGLVHRDVKPANVLVSEHGERVDHVKLVDFGLVKTSSERMRSEDEERYIVGTPLYLAPETIVSPENQDERSDVYALGAVGYFLLTGAAPFSGASLIEVCGHHLHTPVVPPTRRGADVPAELEQLLLSCLEKAPARRPSSVTIASTLSSFVCAMTANHNDVLDPAAPESGVYLRRELAQGTKLDALLASLSWGAEAGVEAGIEAKV